MTTKKKDIFSEEDFLQLSVLREKCASEFTIHVEKKSRYAVLKGYVGNYTIRDIQKVFHVFSYEDGLNVYRDDSK